MRSESSKLRKRKSISDKVRLKVLKRDNYTCRSCGKSPVIFPGLDLEVDHIQPFSLNGTDELTNYQSLCRQCNRGKGNNPDLNRTVKNELDILLNFINPEILKILNQNGYVSVVANQEDYVKIYEKNSLGDFYNIEPSTNTIIGFQTGKNLGIYTRNDNGGAKVNFSMRTII